MSTGTRFPYDRNASRVAPFRKMQHALCIKNYLSFNLLQLRVESRVYDDRVAIGRVVELPRNYKSNFSYKTNREKKERTECNLPRRVYDRYPTDM